jgi:hypothetical protein
LEVSDDDVMRSIKERFRLVDLFVHDWSKNLHLKEPVILEKVINCLRHVLTKHDFDSSSQQHKAAIATMYLPLIPAVVEELDAIREMDLKNRRAAMVCVLWVMRNVPKDLIRQWWVHEDGEFVSDLVALLDMVLDMFKYKGVKERAQSSDFNSILSSEAMASFMDGGGSSTGNVGSLKAGLEDLMTSIHKTGAGGSTAGGVRRSTIERKSMGRSSSNLLAGLPGAPGAPGAGAGHHSMKIPAGAVAGTTSRAGGSSLRAQRAMLAQKSGGHGTFKRGQGQNTMTSTSREFLLRVCHVVVCTPLVLVLTLPPSPPVSW